MAAIAGKDGSLKIGADTMGRCEGWTGNINVEMLEDTYLNDEWDGNLPSIGNWDLTLNLAFDLGDTAQAAVHTAFLAKTAVTVSAYVNATNYYTGSAFINGITVTTDKKSKVTLSVKLSGNGAITYN